jgi:Na+-translocating ferredoxin:NAD+ oxidoreductase RnfD subunit
MQSILNSTNLGIATALFLFPWAGLATPYDFVNQLSGIWVWAVPGIVFLSGIAVHARFTGRSPLLLAWIAGFLLQACLRHGLAGNSWTTVLAPITSTAFIVFSLYMISDPETTPIRALPQTVFGFAVAMVYGVLQVFHVAFGIFLALVIVGAVRGVALHMLVWREQARSAAVPLRTWAATSGDD